MLFPTFLEKKKILGIKNKMFFWFRKTIVDRDSGNLYPIYIYKKIVVLASEPVGGRSRATELPCSDFVSQMWWWFGGGGGCNVFLTFYAISNISRKKNLGIQTNYFSFNVFFVFFLYAGNIKKCPFTYSYWLNGRWFLL